MSDVSYMVSGRLVEAGTRRPMAGLNIIAETGVRNNESPLDLLGVRGPGFTDASGNFDAEFITPGVAKPAEIEVHIEFSRGTWRCRVVPVDPADIEIDGDGVVYMTLGTIEVDYNKCRVPKGDAD